jgi:hypothetical protein
MGFLLDPPEIVSQILLKPLFNQANGHAGVSLDCQVIEQPSAGRVAPDHPETLKAAKVSLNHLKSQLAGLKVFLQLQQHPGTEAQTTKILGAHLFNSNLVAFPRKLA